MINIQKTPVVIVDDNELFREGIKRILNSTDIFEVVFETKNLDRLLQTFDCDPKIFLFNQKIYESSNLEDMKILLGKFPKAKLALFISDINTHDVSKSIELRVLGYLTREMEVESLIEALKTVDRSEHWVSPNMVDFLIKAYKKIIEETEKKYVLEKGKIVRPLHLLSSREYQVLELLANGYNNSSIADELGVTQSTVKNHVTNIFVKMQVNDRTQAVLKAIKNNWVGIEKDDMEPTPS